MLSPRDVRFLFRLNVSYPALDNLTEAVPQTHDVQSLEVTFIQFGMFSSVQLAAIKNSMRLIC